jgi:DNA-binding NarL/FixJ family response regulator
VSRLFLLEDHSWFRRALAQLLELEEEFQVVGEAASLGEARGGISEARGEIDLAIVDLLLPDGIGTDLIRDLRAASPGVPVLVLTVARGPDLYAWVRSMGADEMVSKDASVEEILAVVRVLLKG